MYIIDNCVSLLLSLFVAAAPSAKAAPSASKYAGLFGDSDEEDGDALFGAPKKAAEPVSKPAPSALTKKAAMNSDLFGGDDDDDDGMYIVMRCSFISACDHELESHWCYVDDAYFCIVFVDDQVGCLARLRKQLFRNRQCLLRSQWPRNLPLVEDCLMMTTMMMVCSEAQNQSPNLPRLNRWYVEYVRCR